MYAGLGDTPSLQGHPVAASGYSSYQDNLGSLGSRNQAFRGVDTQQGSMLDSLQGHPLASLDPSPSASVDSRYQGSALGKIFAYMSTVNLPVPSKVIASTSNMLFLQLLSEM